MANCAFINKSKAAWQVVIKKLSIGKHVDWESIFLRKDNIEVSDPRAVADTFNIFLVLVYLGLLSVVCTTQLNKNVIANGMSL